MRRFLKTVLLLLAMNYPLLSETLIRLAAATGRAPGFSGALRLSLLPCLLLLAGAMLLLEILPRYEKGLQFRLQILSGGYELIVTSLWALLGEMVLYLFLLSRRAGAPGDSFFASSAAPGAALLVTNAVTAFVILFFHFQNGFWRTAFCSAQLGISLRLLLFFFWWMPIVHLILFHKWCAVVRRELITARNRYFLDLTRVENAVCRTRYPVVMVHGIFFRDWQYLNYWGRIPRALKKNGATVFYGRQQSSLCIADSARELETQIRKVLAQTGAEKVNLVAHSKGGLDSRYAVSKLGLAPYVASLTTVNTPHRGVQFADALLRSLPQWFIHFVEKRYNAVFRALGDQNPDFLGGVRDLTASSCAVFNENVKDAPGVYYQSVMSKMHGAASAMFPLNFSYLLSKKYEGDNDGLVSVSSASWGNDLGLLTAGRQGISHADMIDLTHKDIKGFDVGEFYVKLFSDLKEKGF